jgi:hypothetical protein
MLPRRAPSVATGAVAAIGLLGAGTRPARSDCRLRLFRADLPAVTVRAGAHTWPVSLEGASGNLLLEPAKPSVTAELAAPLAFRGTVEARTLRLAPKRSVDLFGGRIRIGGHAIGRWSAAEGGIQPSLQDTLGLAVDLPPLVPCVGVQVLNPSLESAWSVAVKPRAKGAASFVPGQIQLFRAPGQGAPIRVAFTGQVGVLERRGSWAQIETAWDDGSRVRGWVRAADVDSRPGVAGGSGLGSAVRGAGGCADPEGFAPVTIRKGAELADGPSGTVWAHVTETIPAQSLPALAPNQTWIRIGSLKGLPASACDPHQFVWVRAADLVSAGRRPATETATPRK